MTTPWLRIDHLYVVLALSAATTAVSLMGVPPNDFWWHMRVGQIIAEQGQIPQSNLFAWSVPAENPHVYAAWLGELLLYGLYSLGGSSTVIFARNILALITFAIIGLEARRCSGSWKLAGLAVALAGLMAINNVVVRPQIFAWVPFALFLLILRRYADSAVRARWLVALPLVMVFWVNVHGSFILGMLIVGAVAVAETARTAFKHEGALARRELGWLYASGGGSFLALFLNPRGLGVVDYVRDLVTDPPSQKLIVEWQPPAPTDPPNQVFFASILLLLVAFALGRARLSLTDALLVGGFLWLAWNGMRYVFWFGLVAMPVLARSLSGGQAWAIPRQSILANAVLAVMLLMPAVLVQPWLLRGMPLPDAYFERMLPPPAPPLLTPETPLGATEFLRSNPAGPGGRLFNDMGHGSYLIWAISGRPVFIDPRVEAYPLAQWEDYLDISGGWRSVELLDRYGADRVLLSLSAQPELSRQLAQSSGWQREYEDRWSEVWRRR